MSSKILLWVALVSLSVACGGGAGGDSVSSTSEEVVAPSTPSTLLGHYLLGPQGAGDADTWINELNLHVDGTFDGNFGDSVSNLSGHFFLANGTYRVAEASQGEVLHVSYTVDGSDGSGSYVVRAHADESITLCPTDATSEQCFSMASSAPPVALSFSADGSVSAAAPLHAGDTALVRYEASRSKCAGKGASVSLLGEIDFPQPEFVDSVNEVDGYYDFLVPVTEGKELTLWFVLANGLGCSATDSSSGKNFSFPIH